MPTIESVRLLATARGNEFMLEIAGSIRDGMRAEGIRCEVDLDELPDADAPHVLQLVVAPHEYFPLFIERHVRSRPAREVAGAVHVLNVEQPGGPWFEKSFRYAQWSRGAFDISLDGVAELRRRGVRAWHAPLGVVAPAPSIDPSARRDIDVLFLGSSSERRDRFFAEHAAIFDDYRCELHLVRVGQPRRSGVAGYSSGPDRSRLLAASKILLNVHARETRYFESHRAGLALASGCVLVTETSHHTQPLVPGTHLVMAPLQDLAHECHRLLREPARLQRIAAAGHELARTRMSITQTCRAILEGARALHEPERSVTSPESERAAIRQRIDAARLARVGGSRDWSIDENAAAANADAARVSVIITTFNYGRFLPESMQSVMASRAVAGGTELVVVDDGSLDDSAEVARRLGDGAALGVRVIRKQHNTGLADARNIGVRESRGEYVVTLDADNWLYPSFLAELTAALDGSRHAAAYPVVRQFDDAGGEGIGLISKYAWSVRDLVRGPYIDALAMFRREALLKVDGYSTELIEHGWFGWEDYDLWLKLATAGASAVHVPRMLASYRAHPQSMVSRTNATTEALAKHLFRKFRRLAEAHPDLDMYFGFPRQLYPDLPPGPHQPSAAEPSSDQIEELERRLDELYASWSWRVTGPLRAAYRYFTGRP